jgi:hypothetical protein
MNLYKRLEALEAAIAAHAQLEDGVDIVHVIIEPDRSIGGAFRMAGGNQTDVSEPELSEIKGGLMPAGLITAAELAEIRRKAHADSSKGGWQ